MQTKILRIKYMIVFQIAYHFTPKNEDDEWNVKCEESIQK